FWGKALINLFMRVLFQCHALSGIAVPSTLNTANFFNYHNLSRAKGQFIIVFLNRDETLLLSKHPQI
ncbi:MAG: hypothetical protein NXI26_22445, partial [bacterium]|nr:hypothetical protein [bacterium]